MVDLIIGLTSESPTIHTLNSVKFRFSHWLQYALDFYASGTVVYVLKMQAPSAPGTSYGVLYGKSLIHIVRISNLRSKNQKVLSHHGEAWYSCQNIKGNKRKNPKR
jgi:hypothetical protein